MGNGENDTAMRRCYICKEIKKLELFAKDVSCSQGYKYRCRDCHNNLTRANGTMRQKYPGKYEELYENQKCEKRPCLQMLLEISNLLMKFFPIFKN